MNDRTHPQSARSAESLKGNGELILVVDDDASVLSVTAMVLGKQNYRVLCANDGRRALAVFVPEMDSVKAVLTDINLPYIDGIVLIRTIQQMRRDMIFIASTGQAHQPRRAELEKLGVTNFLSKPYSTDELLMTLRGALQDCL
jgi:two-component system, cell cycle sensor histidine kinase and response regulator CckA